MSSLPSPPSVDETASRFRLSYARLHGAKSILVNRARTARETARIADGEGEDLFAAAMRGKSRGLLEAAVLLEALENDRRLPPRSREFGGADAN